MFPKSEDCSYVFLPLSLSELLLVKEALPKPCQKAMLHLGQARESWEDLAFDLEEFFQVCRCL